MLVGVAMLQSSAFEAWLALPGIAIGLLLVAGSLEFVGRFEEGGWKLASAIVPIACVAWSIWLMSAGLVLLFAYERLGSSSNSRSALRLHHSRCRYAVGLKGHS